MNEKYYYPCDDRGHCRLKDEGRKVLRERVERIVEDNGGHMNLSTLACFDSLADFYMQDIRDAGQALSIRKGWYLLPKWGAENKKETPIVKVMKTLAHRGFRQAGYKIKSSSVLVDKDDGKIHLTVHMTMEKK